MNMQDKSALITKVAASYHGDFRELERAVGMLMLGDAAGWKLLYLVHDKKTLKKYERILGIKVRTTFPERGLLAKRSVALRTLDKIGDFWKVVRGEITFKERQLIG